MTFWDPAAQRLAAEAWRDLVWGFNSGDREMVLSAFLKAQEVLRGMNTSPSPVLNAILNACPPKTTLDPQAIPLCPFCEAPLATPGQTVTVQTTPWGIAHEGCQPKEAP